MFPVILFLFYVGLCVWFFSDRRVLQNQCLHSSCVPARFLHPRSPNSRDNAGRASFLFPPRGNVKRHIPLGQPLLHRPFTPFPQGRAPRASSPQCLGLTFHRLHLPTWSGGPIRYSSRDTPCQLLPSQRTFPRRPVPCQRCSVVGGQLQIEHRSF